MITYIQGNIFESPRQVIVNPVNCVGVMGKGLALEYKKRYPDLFIRYQAMCNNNKLKEGTVVFSEVESVAGEMRTVCLFPSKIHWKDSSTTEIISQSLEAFVKGMRRLGHTSAAFPKVGCGLGGLNFEHEVKPLLEKFLTLSPWDIDVYV